MLLGLSDDVNIGPGIGLVPSCITWANVDPDLYHHMVSLGNNELSKKLWNKLGV